MKKNFFIIIFFIFGLTQKSFAYSSDPKQFIQEIVDEAKKINYKINTATGDFDLRTKKGREAWDLHCSYVGDLRKKKKNKLNEIKKSFDVSLNRLLFALQENMYQIVEAKYKILDRVIYRITKNDNVLVYNKRDMTMEREEKIEVEEYEFC